MVDALLQTKENVPSFGKSLNSAISTSSTQDIVNNVLPIASEGDFSTTQVLQVGNICNQVNNATVQHPQPCADIRAHLAVQAFGMLFQELPNKFIVVLLLCHIGISRYQTRQCSPVTLAPLSIF